MTILLWLLKYFWYDIFFLVFRHFWSVWSEEVECWSIDAKFHRIRKIFSGNFDQISQLLELAKNHFKADLLALSLQSCEASVHNFVLNFIL